MKKWVLFCVFLGLKAHAEVVCLHHQVCRLVSALVGPQTKVVQVSPAMGDIHHFELDGQTLAQLLKAPKLILPPDELFHLGAKNFGQTPQFDDLTA